MSYVNADGRVVDDRPVTRLRAARRGAVLTPKDNEYDSARLIWNAMIDRRPGVIARCRGAEDVQTALAFAADNYVPVSIRGGGHNIAGLALCDGGLTIDLAAMKPMEVDAATSTATAHAGMTWGEFDRYTQPFGLATTGGAVSTTGIAGLTLGGGLGWLMGRCGYTVDNLLSAQIVLHDGSLVTASESEHADLFWALRGGGGNFGVVTSFQYRLHRVGPVWAGLVAHPIDRLRPMLKFYRDYVSTAPDELTIHAAVMTLPTGDKVAAMLPVWCGDPTDEAARHTYWAPAFWTAMRAWSANRVYMNILGSDEGDRIPEAYGPNYTRLAHVKATYDPLNVFRVNQNIAPAPPA